MQLHQKFFYKKRNVQHEVKNVLLGANYHDLKAISLITGDFVKRLPFSHPTCLTEGSIKLNRFFYKAC